MLRVIVITVLLAVGMRTAHAQKIIVRGKILSDVNEELPGAGVRSKHSINNGTNANESGIFEFYADASDTLIISYIGYVTKYISVQSIGNDALIAMQPELQTMAVVEVLAERLIAEEFTVRKIRKLDIYTNPAAKADPILAVNSMPSATPLDESANISLRGGSPAETGIFLNNVPINDAVRFSQLNGIGTFSIFNTAIVNSVQVYPGNPPLEFGNTTSGLIAIQTDEKLISKPATTLTASLASFGALTSRKISARSSVTLFSNYQPSTLLTKINKKALANLNAFSSADLGIHFYHQFKSGTVAKVFNYSLLESYKFKYAQPSYAGTFHQQKHRNFTVANLRRKIGSVEVSFNQGASFSKAEYKYGTTDIKINLNDLYSSFTVLRSGLRSEWKTGISFDYRQSLFDGRFPTYEFAAAEFHPVSSAKGNQSVKVAEWYGYYKLNLNTRWIAGAGLRKNLGIGKTRSVTAIQGNLHCEANDNLTFNASAGKYYKYILQQTGTDPALVECDQYSFDINFKQRNFESSISAFYRNGNISDEQNTIVGFESFAKFRIIPNLNTQLSFTTLNADRTTGDMAATSPYDIHYFIRGAIEYKIQGTWTITSVFLVRQGSYYQAVSGTIFHSDLEAYEPIYSSDPSRLPHYRTVDFSLSKVFPFTKKSTAVAFVSAGNIMNFKNVRSITYNYDYTDTQYYLFSQRTIYFGMILTF